MKKYDYLVVGTGSANIVTDAAIDAGKTVAIIEQGRFGGTCLNRGCIPTKNLITPIDFKKDFERLQKTGVIEGDYRVNWDNLKNRMWNLINDHSAEVLKEYLAEENVDVYQGRGYFTGEKTLQVELKDGSLSEEMTADIILLANGAKSRIPETKGLDQVDYITSENFFGDHFPEKPYRSLAILGGGVIATEFAHLFANLGTKVTIIQHNPRLIPNFDQDISEVVVAEYKKQNIDVYLHTNLLEITKEKDRLKFLIENADTKEQQMFEAENLMLAIGLSSNSDDLQVEKTGLKTDKRGWIRTNEFLETSVPGIYCIGDANGKFQLRHVANYEAEILAFNLFQRAFVKNAEAYLMPQSTHLDSSGMSSLEENPRRRVRYNVVPAAVFCEPQVASVGLNTKMAKDQDFEVVYGSYHYNQISKTFAMGFSEDDATNFVKVMADKSSHDILGVQIVGPDASILVQIYANLMNSGHHSYEIIDPEIASPETEIARKDLQDTYLDPRKPDALNYTMTIHPALSEVATWAASEVDFEDYDNNPVNT